jgi:hypothetical protein
VVGRIVGGQIWVVVMLGVVMWVAAIVAFSV